MAPEVREESLDALAKSLTEEVRSAVAVLLKEAARVRDEVLNDANMKDGMGDVATTILRLSTALEGLVNTGLMERLVEEQAGRKARRLAEGYDMFQKVSDDTTLGEGKIGVDFQAGTVGCTIDEVMNLSVERKALVRLGWLLVNAPRHMTTSDGVRVLVDFNDEAKAVQFGIMPENLPNSAASRRLLAEEFERAANNTDDEKYHTVAALSTTDLMKMVGCGNVKIVGTPFGEEHPRAAEIMGLCTNDNRRFICLVTDGEDPKIEIYLPA